MVGATIGSFWQAEARTQETREFIRDIKRITRRKFTVSIVILSTVEIFTLSPPL